MSRPHPCFECTKQADVITFAMAMLCEGIPLGNNAVQHWPVDPLMVLVQNIGHCHLNVQAPLSLQSHR